MMTLLGRGRGEESEGETVLCCHPPDAAAMNPADRPLHRAPVCHSRMGEVLKHPHKTSIAMSERDYRRGLPRIRRSTVTCTFAKELDLSLDEHNAVHCGATALA